MKKINLFTKEEIENIIKESSLIIENCPFCKKESLFKMNCRRVQRNLNNQIQNGIRIRTHIECNNSKCSTSKLTKDFYYWINPNAKKLNINRTLENFTEEDHYKALYNLERNAIIYTIRDWNHRNPEDKTFYESIVGIVKNIF